MIKKIVPIKGMHCRSCEVLIGQKLKRLPSAHNVQVSWQKKQAIIYSEKSISNDLIRQAVFDAGYDVGEDDAKRLFSNNIEDYYSLIFSLIVIYFLYSLAKALGFSGVSTGGSNPSSLLVVLLVGLTAGISTCMALVGGLILGISARHSEKHPEATTIQKFRPHIFFNIGRIASYTILGGVLGLVGKAFQFNGPTLGIMTIAVGLVMLTLGLQLTEIFPKLSSISFSLPASISSFLGIKKHEKEYSHTNSALIGALTFFLPCGFTQAMQLYAISTGSFWQGAGILGVFALGTAPGLLGIGGLTSVLKGSSAKKFFRFTGALVLILAVLNISNGFNLTGWSNPFAFAKSSSDSTDQKVAVENGVQIVKMDQSANGYSPNQFTIQKDIPVKWTITSKSSGSCASSIFMPKYNIRRALKSGENVIEFTPTEAGDVRFTCSMGMYSGKFKVIAKTSSSGSITASQTATKQETATSTPFPENAQAKTEVPKPSSTENIKSQSSDEVQVIKTTYNSNLQDISPRDFKVKAGKKVRMEIEVLETSRGCMSTILIPGLVDEPELLEKGKAIVWEFTPQSKDKFEITCAMGVPRGTLTVE